MFLLTSSVFTKNQAFSAIIKTNCDTGFSKRDKIGVNRQRNLCYRNGDVTINMFCNSIANVMDSVKVFEGILV